LDRDELRCRRRSCCCRGRTVDRLVSALEEAQDAPLSGDEDVLLKRLPLKDNSTA
jgi:hypothetical protein